MTKQYDVALFIFRRDLRCDDNRGFMQALDAAVSVIPCLMLDTLLPEMGEQQRQFFGQALVDLDATLYKRWKSKLYCFEKSSETHLNALIKKAGAQAIFINRMYTPQGQAYEAKLAALCKKHKIDFHTHDDAALVEPERITKHSGGYYTVFTPFCKALLTFGVQAPVHCRSGNLFSGTLPGTISVKTYMNNVEAHKRLDPVLQRNNKIMHGTRKAALNIINQLSSFSSYNRDRNLPALDATTHLSAYIALGLCSIREVFYAVQKELGRGHTLIKELCWHDFFLSISLHHPHVFGHAFHQKFDRLTWSGKKSDFKRWCTGTTGFPIVDAGMRELNATGFMHNRVRMIVGSFLVKDLHINWQWGEKYFAEKLIDYDPAVNNGNWQWVASTGCDAQPYFRIFNPWLQQKTYDRDARYIKRWVTELADVPVKDIHMWHKAYAQYSDIYAKPMVDHVYESKRALAMYKKING